MHKMTLLALTGVLSACFASCKPAASQAEVSEVQSAQTLPPAAATPAPQPRQDPLIKLAQTMINQRNQGRACTSLNTKRTRLGEELESADYGTTQRDTAQYRQWNYLAQRGVAQRREDTVEGSGEPYTTFIPDLTLKEGEGKGFYIHSGSQLLYCYGRWTVTEATPTDRFTPTRPDMQALSTTVVLTGAPAWATGDAAANILNQINARSEKDGTILVAVDDYDKPVPAVLNAPNTVWVQTLKSQE